MAGVDVSDTACCLVEFLAYGGSVKFPKTIVQDLFRVSITAQGVLQQRLDGKARLDVSRLDEALKGLKESLDSRMTPKAVEALWDSVVAERQRRGNIPVDRDGPSPEGKEFPKDYL